jgi:hypothetical protein
MNLNLEENNKSSKLTSDYKLIGQLIDQYIDENSIRPSRLKHYLKPGGKKFLKFLERNRLKDIPGCERILSDVIEDRVAMEKDGILTLEQFKLFESVEFRKIELGETIYKGIEKADIEMEKKLADYFDTNLGNIDIIDSDKHHFKIEDWNNDDYLIICYSDEDLEIIKQNITDYFYFIISETSIDLVDGISLTLSGVVDEENLAEKLENMVFGNKLYEIIASVLGEEWSYEGTHSGLHIWIS